MVNYLQLAARGYQIKQHCRFACASLTQPDSGESCIVVECRLTRDIFAKLPQCSLQYANLILQ